MRSQYIGNIIYFPHLCLHPEKLLSMKIKDIKLLVASHIEEHSDFQIKKADVEETGQYKDIIKDKLPKKNYGVYVWVNSETEEILYIGMAGKMYTGGKFSKQTISERLCNTRGGKSPKDAVLNIMIKECINSLDFHIMYLKKGEPPSYIEALMLYNYYKKTNNLPKYNNWF